MTVYGYARVSSNGQTLADQDAALAAADVAKTYREKVSAVATRRPELEKVLRRLGPGDTLVVTKLDRLARSTRDLLNIIDGIAKAGAGFKSLGDAWADTTTSHGRLMLTVLGGIAEFERDLIRSRTEDGRNARAPQHPHGKVQRADQASAGRSAGAARCGRNADEHRANPMR